jgi:hypothetical protein
MQFLPFSGGLAGVVALKTQQFSTVRLIFGGENGGAAVELYRLQRSRVDSVLRTIQSAKMVGFFVFLMMFDGLVVIVGRWVLLVPAEGHGVFVIVLERVRRLSNSMHHQGCLISRQQSRPKPRSLCLRLRASISRL